MKIVYATSSSFVRSHFGYTRRALTGSSTVTTKVVLLQKSNPHWRKAARILTNFALVISLFVVGVILAPSLYYAVAPVDVVPVAALEEGSALGGDYQQTQVAEQYLPPRDETLPTGSWMSIPKIGVRSQLRATTNPEEALRQGLWLSPEHGVPGDVSQPMIVAAHRYGYKVWWQDDYWKYHSFYNLPELQPGDVVEVIHDQRKYLYEIYAGEEGDVITDYRADMILYTCKFLNSPVRHFRYARLVDPTQDSQV